MSEKRERKTTERLNVGEGQKEVKELVIPAGKGQELGEVLVGFESLKSDHDLVKALHLILFASVGTKTTRKKNIRKFKGYAPNDGVGLQKRIDKVLDNKKVWTLSALKDLCTLLGIEKGGDRETIVKRVFEFLDKPSGSGSSKRKREDSGGKRKSSSSSKGKGKKAKKEKGPKRPPGAFMLFYKDKRPSIMEKNPDIAFGEVGKKLGELWASCKESEKNAYKAKAEKLKSEWDKEHKGDAAPKKKAQASKKPKKSKKEEEAEEEDEDVEEDEEEGDDDDDDDDGEPDEKKAKADDEDGCDGGDDEEEEA